MPLTFNPQRLRETQLSASKSHAQAWQDARNPTSASQSRKPRSSRNAADSLIGDPDIKAGLEEAAVRATLPSALNVINASSVGKLVQLVTASRLILYHEGQVDPVKDECHYQIKH